MVNGTSTANDQSDNYLVAALFMTGLGYALLSFCLYRILCFISVSVPFFVLYIGIGFPAGACLTALFIRNMRNGFRLAVMMLPVSGIGILLMSMGGIHFWHIVANQLFVSFNLLTLLFTIFILTAISLPFFIIWGGVEFISFKLILANHSTRSIFYVLTIAALLCAFVIGSVSVPFFGLLRTVALVPFFALFAMMIASQRFNRTWMLLALVCCAVIWMMAGRYETAYTKKFYYDNVIASVRDMKQGGNPSMDEGAFSTSLLHSFWGKYCHLAFIHLNSPASARNNDAVVCCYDGFPIWETSPQLSKGFFDNVIFEGIKKHADICIIGAGGGKQVAHAINAGARKVVAVDIIPEIFSALKGDLSWTNGNIYNLSRVQTVAADGLQYIRESGQTFDYIVLPSAESFAFILKSFFEPGQQIHTLAAFREFRDHLNPGGELIIFKDVDKDGKLFHSFAKTLKAAGLNVSGFIIPSKPFDHFLLVASHKSPPRRFSYRVLTALKRFNAHYVNFQQHASKGVVLTANSPWHRGVFGNMGPSAT